MYQAKNISNDIPNLGQRTVPAYMADGRPTVSRHQVAEVCVPLSAVSEWIKFFFLPIENMKIHCIYNINGAPYSFFDQEKILFFLIKFFFDQ